MKTVKVELTWTVRAAVEVEVEDEVAADLDTGDPTDENAELLEQLAWNKCEEDRQQDVLLHDEEDAELWNYEILD